MYREFRSLLAAAEGRNEWVAAINADIRGFTSVMSGDPAQTALYLRAVYAEILDGYFQARSFFKPTGDGLLLVVPFGANDEELGTVTVSVVGDALQLHDKFSEMIAGHKLVKFPHPKTIGIGISIGSVSRLASGDLTLDYTGRSLNVASRLMDLARPSGVVFDSTLDFSALGRLQERFQSGHVYLKGVAEQDGVDVYYTDPPTRIPERYRKPLAAPERFEQPTLQMTRAEATKRGASWWEELIHEPADRSDIEVVVTYPSYRGGKRVEGVVSWFNPPFEYVLHRGKPHVTLDFEAIGARVARAGVPARVDIQVNIAYTVDPDVLAAAADDAAPDGDIPF